MADTDMPHKQVQEIRERVCKALKIHRDLAGRGKNPAVATKMNDLLAWLEKQSDPAWWIKNQKHCDSSVAGINALWRDYQLDTFGEVLEKEVTLRM